MSPLPLLLAAAIASADGAPPPPATAPAEETDATPASSDAAAPPPARPFNPKVSVALGLNGLRYDGIPVTLGAARIGWSLLRAPAPGRSARFGLGLFVEGAWGRTENGLHTGAFVTGPHFVAAADGVRGSVGLELGMTSIRRATDAVTELLATAYLRGALEADLWHFESSALFVAVTGSVGGSVDGIPLRGFGGFLGLRL
jgi:hypothetical protein